LINNNNNIKNVFRYVENNIAVDKSVDVLYQMFIDSTSEEYKNCLGYELYINPLSSIDIICNSEEKYNTILNNSSKIKNFINKYEDKDDNEIKYVNIYREKEGDIFISFKFNINDIEDDYHTFILKVISDMLSEIFSICKNDIIPLQVRLVVYNHKDLVTSEIDNVAGYHRTFMIFKKMDDLYTGYYYDPEGNKDIYYTNVVNNLIEKLNYKKIKIKPINETCPIGIQSLLKDVDIGLCTIYSHFWYHCFIEIIYVIKKYDRKYGNRYNLDLHKINIDNYINYINKCIVDYSFRVNLINNNNNYSVIFKNKTENKTENKTVINMFFNYAMYIIGFVFSKLSEKDKNKLLNYIKKNDKTLIKKNDI